MENGLRGEIKMSGKTIENNGAAEITQKNTNKTFQEKIQGFWNSLPKNWRICIMLISAGLLLIMPVFGTWWTRVLINTGLMMMCALGLNVVLGNVGQFFLGYIAYYGIGAYMYAILASPFHDIHLPFLLVFVLAGATTGIFGALISLPTARLRGDYLALVTLALGEVFYLVVNNLSLTNGALGIMSIDKPNIFGITIGTPKEFYYLVIFVVFIEAILLHRFSGSRMGRAMAAIREDEDAASAMGLNTTYLKVLANGFGAIFGGFAGVIFAAVQTFVSPVSFTIAASTIILSFVVVGGNANVPGVIIGTLLLSVLPEPLRKYTANYRMLLYSVLLLIFAVKRPQGIWPASHKITMVADEFVKKCIVEIKNRKTPRTHEDTQV